MVPNLRTRAPMTTPTVADGPARERGALGWAIAGVGLAVVAAAVMYVSQGGAYEGADFGVYHQAAVSVLHGLSPYAFVNPHELKFIYTPFAAVVLSPLGLLSNRAALSFWTLLSVLALDASTWLVLAKMGTADRRSKAMVSVLVTVAVLPLYPLFSEFALGQINILLMFMVLADLLLLRRRWGGIGIGLAAGIKLTPLIFVPYLLFTRRWREAAVATATFAGTVALGFVVQPGVAARYWTAEFADVNRMLPPGSSGYNDALSAVLGRLLGHPTQLGLLWTSLSVLAGLAALALAIVASRRGEDLLGIVTCAVAGELISPVSWPAHWGWLVLVFVLWGRRAIRLRSRRQAVAIVLVWLALVIDTGWNLMAMLGHPLPPGIGNELLADLTLLTGIAFLVCVALVLHRMRSIEKGRSAALVDP